ncbi:MAG: DEAD/DEAH box helicase [Sulfolobales archaeon]|nr:DEAD/DEAH box helicase [Sulfolobales archaeon]
MSITAREFARKLAELGYKELTPIQKVAIPLILKGHDVLVMAPTGHGKTEAAVFPVFYEIASNGLEPINALYVTPLRALNRDIANRISRIGEALGVKVMTRHGDTPQSERRRISASPPHVLITTPESLQFLILQDSYRRAFQNLRFVIVDEVQELLDDKRGLELSIVLERLKRITNHRLQMIGLSATVGDVETAKRFLNPSGEVEVASVDAVNEMEVRVVTAPVDERIMNEAFKAGLKPQLYARLITLKELIERHKPVLVFTNVRDTAEFLASELKRLSNLELEVHHGSLSKDVRLEVERRLKEGEVDAVFATSSLELGIDVGKINAVIQYMSPRQVTRLIQRVGRSGHRIGSKSLGFIVPGDNVFDALECLAIVEKMKEGYLERPTVEEKPYDVVAHQLVGMVLEGYKDLNQVLEVIKSSYFFKDLTLDELVEIASFLESAKVIKLEGTLIRPSARAKSYYFTTSMIPDSVRSFRVVDVETDSIIGELDEEFVSSLSEGEVFVLGGRLWRVVSVEKERIYVERAKEVRGLLPTWFGESIPVEKEVALKVYEMIAKAFRGDLSGLPQDVAEELSELVSEHKRRGYPEVGPDRIVVEVSGDVAVIHSPLGTRGNNTLGSVLSGLFKSLMKPTYRSNAYFIALASPSGIQEQEMREVVETFLKSPKEVLLSRLETAVKNSPNFKWKLFIEAERFGAIEKGSEFNYNFSLLKPYAETVVGTEAVKELIAKEYDVEALDRAKEMEWVVVKVPSFSPLAETFLSQLLLHSDSNDSPVMLEIIKRRLSSKELRLICLTCGWSDVRKAGEVPQRCPKCGGAFLAVTYPDDSQAVEVVRKSLKGEKLKGAENRKLRELKATASYYPLFGKYVALAIAARGVGAGNLARVLAELDKGEEAFFKAVMEEEKRFLRTRKYWQD